MISTLALRYIVILRYISTSLKRKLRDNIDVIDYFAGDNETYEKAKECCGNIDIAEILGKNIDIVSVSAMAISTHL